MVGLDLSISEAYRLLFSLLSILAPPYNEALDWIRFAYMGDRLGTYVAPGSTELDFITLT